MRVPDTRTPNTEFSDKDPPELGGAWSGKIGVNTIGQFCQ